jgi:FkbM family methyltransferase
MIQQLREKINSMRLNRAAKKRNELLASEIDPKKIAHLIPTVNCPSEWYGNEYGGFYINPKPLNSSSIVYSIGIGKDISFDKTCMKNHNCMVFGFDPTPKSINFIASQKLPKSFSFFDFGITASESGMVTFYLPTNPKGVSGSLVESECVDSNNSIRVKMRSFDDIVKQLGHTHIDVLKMDIEGSEYEVLPKILESTVTIDQFLVEFHDRLFDQDNYKSKEVVKMMNAKGYEVFAASNTYEEISFIRKGLI